MNRPKSGRFSKRPYGENVLNGYFESVSDACPTDLCPGLVQRLAGIPRPEWVKTLSTHYTSRNPNFIGLMLRNSAYTFYRTRKGRGSSGKEEGRPAAVVPVVVGLSVSDRAELDNQ